MGENRGVRAPEGAVGRCPAGFTLDSGQFPTLVEQTPSVAK